jgi:hypothetical protein
MRTNIQPLFDEFKLHATDDYVFRGFSGRIRQLVIQGVDTPTKAAWVAEFVQELTARMRKCEYTVSLRPEPWFPKVPSHIRFGIYVVINQGVIPVDDLDQSELAEWHALEGRQFATAAAFLAMSSDRPADPVQGDAPQSPAPPRTSVGKLLCWNDRSVTCFRVESRWDVSPLAFIRRIDMTCLSQAVEIACVIKGNFIPLANIGPYKIIVHDAVNTHGLNDTHVDVIMCIAGTVESELLGQLPAKFNLYEHVLEVGHQLVNNTEDVVVVCESGAKFVSVGMARSFHCRTVHPGGIVGDAEYHRETVVCSEPVLQFAK